MKSIIVFGVFCVLVCSVLAAPKDHEADHENEHDSDSNECDFQEYKKKFGKHYAGQEEEDKAEAAFTEKCKQIEKHNNAAKTRSGGASFQIGQNQFSDIPHDEFVQTRCGLRLLKRNATTTRAGGFSCPWNPPVPAATIPATYDARTLGLVNTPEHQGECGDCYAFSATGAMEAAYKKLKGQLINFSEQQIASCSQNRPNSNGLNRGCKGGHPTVAFEYTNSNGIELDSDYRYSSMQGSLASCMANPAKYKTKVTGCGWHSVETGKKISVQDIQKLLIKYGALSISMDAGGAKFSGYKGGLYRGDTCGKTKDDINHAVLLVGWGTEKGQDYWLVKNSWGATWGEGGYFRIARGINECAIEMDLSYVTQI